MTQQIGIYDHETGDQITRDMTPEELQTYEAETIKNVEDKAKKDLEMQEAKDALLTSLKISEAQAITLGLIKPPHTPINTSGSE
jgi:hypothetical protein